MENVNNKNIFHNLFVLELANNHWGCLERGRKIVKEFAKVVKKHHVKAAIKLQFRDMDTFIHKDYREEGDGEDLPTLPKRSRYIQKTSRTKLTKSEIISLVEYIKQNNCIPMSTPFDEKSVDLCVELGLPIIKVASSDINDWFLLNKIANTKKPVIISTGGANEKQIDDVVKYFKNRSIPISINHCVSKYPSEDHELELNQIDYLINRYPDVCVGLSTHEYTDWYSSMYISYAKGARTWERHIDIPYPEGHEQKEISKYCSQPHEIDVWLSAFKKAKLMCGNKTQERRSIDEKEKKYLLALQRGLYLKRDLPKGHVITSSDLYSAVPYLGSEDHINSREYVNNLYICRENIKKDTALRRRDIA
jgi:N-acetylneuraminate synthase